MGYELIITEKPSAALKIATALSDGPYKKLNIKGAPYYVLSHKGKDIVVTCAVGHLYTVTEKKKSFSYPVYDLSWMPTYLIDKAAGYSKKYLDAITELSKKASTFTVACDYDIEGEVIGLNCIRFACKKEDAARMKFSTLTKPELVEAFEGRQKHLDWPQAQAGETRHMLDWLYGINLSRALTIAIRKNKEYKTLSSGRVQGPALKIIVDREKEIKIFKPQKFWQIQMTGKAKGEKIEAWHEKDKFWDEAECKKVMDKVKGKSGAVKDVTKSQQNSLPPTPFDLTTLQTESYSVFGISPKDTLALAQDLYLGGLISYPRTSSQKLPLKLGFKKIMQELSRQPHYKPLTDLLLKTSLQPREGPKEDPAHPAIYPTGEIRELNVRERKIYDLIVKRFFACFGENAVRESLKVDIDVNSEMFIAKGITTVKKGWQIFYEPYVKLEENTLPPVQKGDAVTATKFAKLDKETQPPKRYTEASIIKELEKRNLGTKATRAAIVDALFHRNYINGKALEATELGIRTVSVLEKYCPDIIDENLTRHFEDEMDEIREKKRTPEQVLTEAKGELSKTLDKFRKMELAIGKELAEAYKETLNEENFIGKCQKCGQGNLRLIFSKKTRKKYIACDKYPDCKTIFNVPQAGKIKGTGKACPVCGMPMVDIIGRRRQTLCINPSCKSKEPKDSEIKKEAGEIAKGIVEQDCPLCKVGKLVLRKSFYGEFLGCSTYPKCRYIQKLSSDGPLKEDFSKKAK